MEMVRGRSSRGKLAGTQFTLSPGRARRAWTEMAGGDNQLSSVLCECRGEAGHLKSGALCVSFSSFCASKVPRASSEVMEGGQTMPASEGVAGASDRSSRGRAAL